MNNNSYLTIILLTMSLTVNGIMGFFLYYQSKSTPNHEDQMILGEMTRMVVDSEKYQEIESRLKIFSIKPFVNHIKNRHNSVKDYEIHVLTEVEDYVFVCSDDVCSDVVHADYSFSHYIDDKKSLLPLKKE